MCLVIIALLFYFMKKVGSFYGQQKLMFSFIKWSSFFVLFFIVVKKQILAALAVKHWNK
jgi:hypothetical protein